MASSIIVDEIAEMPFAKRLAFASLPVFSLIFTVFFFGPIDLYISNMAHLEFSLSDITSSLSMFVFILLLLLTPTISLTRSLSYRILIALIIGLSIACYIQGNFLNIDLGVLDGTDIDWTKYTWHAIVNSVTWLFLIGISIYLSINNKTLFTRSIIPVAVLLIFIQSVSLIISLPSMQPTEPEDYFLSSSEQFTLSSKENIVVISLDKVPNVLFDNVVNDYPEIQAHFSDFTRFANNASTYNGTFPSLVYCLTGELYDPSIPVNQFFTNAWTSVTANGFYELLHQNGYLVNVFYNVKPISGTADLLVGKVDNVVEKSTLRIIDNKQLIYKMLRFSGIRYLPHALKQYSWISTSDLNGLVIYDDWQTTFKDDFEFAQHLRSNGLTLRNDKNLFYFVHLLGGHGPHNMNAQMEYVETGVSRTEHLIGSLNMVAEFLRQMKELGIYENATIIITSDHGDSTRPSALLMMKQKGETHESLKINYSPTANSDLLATIASLLTDDYFVFGPSILDLNENTNRIRELYIWDNDDSLPPKGRYNILKKYYYEQDVSSEERIISEGDYEVIPVDFPFY